MEAQINQIFETNYINSENDFTAVFKEDFEEINPFAYKFFRDILGLLNVKNYR